MLILITLELQNILKNNLQLLIPKFLQSAEKNRNIQIPCLAYLSLPDWGSIILFFALCKCKKKFIEIKLIQHAQILKNSNLIISHSKITEKRLRGPVKKKRIISQTPWRKFSRSIRECTKIVEHKSESCKESCTSCSVHKFDEVWQFIDSTQWR